MPDAGVIQSEIRINFTKLNNFKNESFQNWKFKYSTVYYHA